MAWLVARSSRSAFVACASVGALTLSKAFVDYSTSGLENPLSHLLIAMFVISYLSSPSTTTPRALLRLTLLASLALVNRLDVAFLLLPCLAERVLAAWREARPGERASLFRAVAWGATPLIGWELFSFFYYGAFIPNSALAKLTSGVPRLKLMGFGLLLIRDSIARDPLTLLCIAVAVTAGFARGSTRARVLAIGIVLTLVYIVRVGGDHMSGRFFTVPLLASVLLLGRIEIEPTRPVMLALTFAGVTAAWMAGFPTLNTQYTTLGPGAVNDIEDYQREWYAHTGLLSRSPLQIAPDHDWIHAGETAREHPNDVPVWGGIGLAGYYAGPDVRVVDMYGLSDALLARLQIPDAKHERYFKPGHFRRPIPDGYLDTVRDGQNKIMHPALAMYYDKLALVTQGPLFSPGRLYEAIKLNLGVYDHWLKEYEAFADQKPVDAASLPPAHESNAGDPMHDCPTWSRPCLKTGVAFSDAGVRVKLVTPVAATAMQVELPRARWDVVFLSHDVEVGRTSIEAAEGRTTIPLDAAQGHRGFDSVSFIPRGATADSWTLTYFQMLPAPAPP
jgi:arabinofuranosyltransferase